jgi:hypothetical protein
VLLAVLVALTAWAAPAPAAVAETCLSFDGAMTFAPIQGVESSEDYCWEVQLAEGQELRQIDGRDAAVYYASGHIAFVIPAEEAHDAQGASVPTTLTVSQPNLITLTVHHREGNPAAGGAPFVYPVLNGAGWEGGLQAVEIAGPPDESESRQSPSPAAPAAEEPPPPPCVVPILRGRSLRSARVALRRANCRLGPVHGERGRGARVVRQYRAAGKSLAAGTEVGVKLG